MWIKDEVTTGYELEQKLWGQAKDTWQKIFNAGKKSKHSSTLKKCTVVTVSQ